MSALAVGFRTFAVRLVAAPSAVFLAVLTAGLATSSTARHTGVFTSSVISGNRPSVVLACPRTGSAAARASASTSATVPCRKFAARTSSVAAAVESPSGKAEQETLRTEKQGESKIAVGGGRVAMPLPDFRTPALTRFTSPL